MKKRRGGGKIIQCVVKMKNLENSALNSPKECFCRWSYDDETWEIVLNSPNECWCE